MPYCIRCGKEVLPTDRYCPNCGQNAEGRTGSTTVPTTPPSGPDSPALNYCSNCGVPLAVGQNFCRNCGIDFQRQGAATQTEPQRPATTIRGLGRNTLVYLTPDGLHGVTFHSGWTIVLAVLLPIPVLAAAYLVLQTVALAVFGVAWMALSFLLYDELRWRSFRKLDTYSPSGHLVGGAFWLVPWRSVRMADWNGRTLWFSSFHPAHKLSVTFNREDAPLVERSLASWGIAYIQKQPRLPKTLTRFSTLALIFFAASQLILILAAVLPFFPGEKQTYSTILNSTRSQVASATFLEALRAIYVNNIQVAWGGMLPALGQLSFGLASYNTGRVIQMIAISDHYPPAVILISLYLLPHTWVEESAYPIATVAGLLAITRWRSVSPGEFVCRANWGSWKLIFAMGGVALILLAAGLIETAGLYLGIGELLLWIPVVAIIYLGFTITRARRRRPPTLGSA